MTAQRTFAAATLAFLLAGCTATDTTDTADVALPMGPGSYQVQLSGMPTTPLSPGAVFNVSVQGMAGMQGMHAMMSDHIGAHFWNDTMMDPTAAVPSATSCAHTGGSMPGNFTARCTAPMEPGTYHLRAHARMMDEGSQMHHYWSAEQTFTVA